MPLYSVALRMARESGGIGLYKWSNVFHAVAANATGAALAGLIAWTENLIGACRNDVYCYEVYATDVVAPNSAPTPGTSDFATELVPAGQQRGTIAPPSTEQALYWPDVCVNVELTVPSSRPDRKYWRPGLREFDFSAQGQLNSPALVTAINAAFTQLVIAETFVSGDAESFSGARLTKAGIRRLGRQSRFDVPPPPPVG